MEDYSNLNKIIKDLMHLRVDVDTVQLSDQYTLGRGSYSDIESGGYRSAGGSTVAVKQPYPPCDRADFEQYVAEISAELDTWAMLRHPNILPLQAFCAQISNLPEVVYLSPLAQYGNLCQYRRERRPNQVECLKLALDIGEALCYLHKHSPPLIHGDVHPRHVLINDKLDALLCDFRLTAWMRSSPIISQAPRFSMASLRYLSPEALKADNKPYLTTQGDVWAWGCLVAELFTGVAPYHTVAFEPAVAGCILSGRSPADVNHPNIPLALQTLLAQCLHPAPRPSMPTLIADLRRIHALYSNLETLKPHRIDFDAVSTDNVPLGEGGYGTVYRGMHGSVVVAVKKIRHPRGDKGHLKFSLAVARELTVWAGLQHPHILPLLGFCLSDALDTAWLLSPLATLGDINQYVAATQADQIRRLQLLLELTKAICYLHDLEPPVCHGDIKPANVLINDTHHVFLCDFGLSRAMSEIPSGLTTSELLKGSMRYLSPEVLDATSPPFLTVQSDIWAWGCSAWEVLTGIIPHPAAISHAAVVKSVVLSEQPADLTNPGIASDIRACLKQCWQKDSRPPLSRHLKVLESVCELGYKYQQPETITPYAKQDITKESEPVYCLSCDANLALYDSQFCENCAETYEKNGNESFRGSGDRYPPNSAGPVAWEDSSDENEPPPLPRKEPSEGKKAKWYSWSSTPFRKSTNPSRRTTSSEPNNPPLFSGQIESNPNTSSKGTSATVISTPRNYRPEEARPILAQIPPNDPQFEQSAPALTLWTNHDTPAYDDVVRYFFLDRWIYPRRGLLAPPEVHTVLEITLPAAYEERFINALEYADDLGGAETKAVFFWGPSTCNVGIGGEGPCANVSCAICAVIRKGFDVIEYGSSGYVGSLGTGIYAYTSPTMAARLAVTKSTRNLQAMILCSVVLLEDYVRGIDRTKCSAVIEDSGRVYCARKEFIIPRLLIIYEDR